MIVYQLDLAGLFIGETEADESPLQPGVFLIPGRCVIEQPPAVGEGERARFTGDQWVVEPTPEPEPEPAEPSAQVQLIAYAADRRWRNEVGGIVIAGVPVATDDRSKVMITGARVAAMADPNWSTVWHGADGQTYPVNAASMVAISDAVQAHVNSGFAAFAAVKVAIDAGTITTTAEIDAAFEGAD